jgi:hypothetical protein
MLLLLGLRLAGAASVSLWLTFELAATALLGAILFREPLGSSMPKVRMRAAAALAMQWRALGSMLLERRPVFISFTAA